MSWVASTPLVALVVRDADGPQAVLPDADNEGEGQEGGHAHELFGAPTSAAHTD